MRKIYTPLLITKCIKLSMEKIMTLIKSRKGKKIIRILAEIYKRIYDKRAFCVKFIVTSQGKISIIFLTGNINFLT